MKAFKYFFSIAIALLFLGCETDSSVGPSQTQTPSYWNWSPVYVARGPGVGLYEYAHKYRDCDMLLYVVEILEYSTYKFASEDKSTGTKVPCYKCQGRES